jgi:hypothetical protein
MDDPGILHVSAIRCDKELIAIFRRVLFQRGLSQAEFFRYILDLFMLNDPLMKQLVEGAAAYAKKERALAAANAKIPKRLSQSALYDIFERARKEKKIDEKPNEEGSQGNP